jgi:hypothetical protein
MPRDYPESRGVPVWVWVLIGGGVCFLGCAGLTVVVGLLSYSSFMNQPPSPPVAAAEIAGHPPASGANRQPGGQDKSGKAPTFDPNSAKRTLLWLIQSSDRHRRFIVNGPGRDAALGDFYNTVRAVKSQRVSWEFPVDAIGGDAAAGEIFLEPVGGPFPYRELPEMLRAKGVLPGSFPFFSLSPQPAGARLDVPTGFKTKADPWVMMLKKGEKVRLEGQIQEVHYSQETYGARETYGFRVVIGDYRLSRADN